MKLDYNYFLQRRNLTTDKIINSNKITTYSEFVELLLLLKVKPPSKEEVSSFFTDQKSKTEVQIVHNKVEKKDDKKVTSVSAKKTRPRKTTSRNTDSKIGQKSPAKRTRSVRKKKSSD